MANRLKVAHPRKKSPFSTIEEAIDAIRAGRIVIVIDDEDRENEGDLTVAARQKLRPSTSISWHVTDVDSFACR